MNPNYEQKNDKINLNERIDELLMSDEEAELYEAEKLTHIEDLDSLSPEEREFLRDYLALTKNRIDLAKWLSDLSVAYNDPETTILQKREIEQLIRNSFGDEFKENAERAIEKMKEQGKIDKELEGTPDLTVSSRHR